MKVGIIGTGYVGLVAGCCLADSGNDVICGDIDEWKVKKLNDGVVPIYEPGLDVILLRNIKEGRLKFTTDIPSVVKESYIIFIAVGTPCDEDGSCDLKHVLDVCRVIGENINEEKIIIMKSTVPVGTCDKLKSLIASLAHHPFQVVSNPEFLKEGDAVNDFLKPDRIVIGIENDKIKNILIELFQPFVRTGNPIIFTDLRSSEMIKYVSNAMLALRISFMNEMALLCEKVGADIAMVRKGVGTDPRIGSKFLFPGVGYGGSCFPKDVKALIETGKEHNFELKILKSCDEVNERQKKVLLEKIDKHFKGNVEGKVFAVWGLSFKPNTDDMREAPSITIINGILSRGGKVQSYDPEAISEAKKIFEDRIIYTKNNYDALRGADALVLITEWNEFRNPDFEKIKSLMKGNVIFDGRNIFPPQKLKAMGFTYYGIGVK